MNWRVIGIMLITFSHTGCGTNYTPGQLQRTVQPHPNREGIYLVYYKYKEMIEEYGPGWKMTLAAVQRATNNEEIQNIWTQALTYAVPKYLNDKGLIPSACNDGVVVVSSNMDEAGGGTTAFRCR